MFDAVVGFYCNTVTNYSNSIENVKDFISYNRNSFKYVVAFVDDEDMMECWKFFLKTIKDNTLGLPFFIVEIQTSLETVFDAIADEKN